MSLVATRIEYVDFRNMERRALEPDAGLTVLVGPNAVGKTNCIEGVYLVTTGRASDIQVALPTSCGRGRAAAA